MLSLLNTYNSNNRNEGKFSKREVLSIIAKLSYPSGWVGPIIVISNMLMQQICHEKTNWDEWLNPEANAK